MSRLYEAIEHYQRKLPGVGEVEAVIGPAAALAYYLIRAPEFFGYDETLNAIRTSSGKVAVIEWIRAYKTGAGDGDRVLQTALDDFARKGVSRVFLLPVAGELQGARIRFFERHGFHTLGLDVKKPKRPMVRGNPQPIPGVPIEFIGRTERVTQHPLMSLTPDVNIMGQISRTGHITPITHGDMRLFVYVQDAQGRGSYFYQSFAGTGGKQQGVWFPTAGPLANYRGDVAWIIKGSPKTDPGAGREGLLALYEKVNELLPHSDDETFILVKQWTGLELDDFTYANEFEIKPLLRITEAVDQDKLAKWRDWAYQFWALHGLTKTWGPRTFNFPAPRDAAKDTLHTNPLGQWGQVWQPSSMQEVEPPLRRNRTDLAGRHVPEKYLEGLPPELQRQRLAEFTESRDAYHRGEFGELPTDKKARELGLVKLSAYRVVAMQRGFDVSQVSSLREMAENALRYYGDKKPSKKVVDDLTAGLEKVYQKGLAAWQSGGHRPGATGQNWADARVASVLVGGKAAWTADNKQFNLLPAEVRRELIAQLPDVYAALTSQGRKHDVEYIQSAASNPRHLSAFYAASSIYRWPFGLRENEKGYPKPYSPQNPINRPWEYLK